MIRKERMVYDMICWRLEEGGVLGTKKEKLPKWCAVGDDVPYESSLLQKRNILVEAGNLASKHLLDGAVARGLQVGGPLHPILDRSLPAPGQKPRHLTAARALDQSSHLTSDSFFAYSYQTFFSPYQRYFFACSYQIFFSPY